MEFLFVSMVYGGFLFVIIGAIKLIIDLSMED